MFYIAMLTKDPEDKQERLWFNDNVFVCQVDGCQLSPFLLTLHKSVTTEE